MSLFRAIPLFLNSGIFAAIGYGNRGNFAAVEEKWLCVVYDRQLCVESSPLRAVLLVLVFVLIWTGCVASS